MRNRLSQILLITVVLAIYCFIFSVYVLSESRIALVGYEDCRGFDSISIPNRCAGAAILSNVEELEFKSRILFYSALVLSLVSLFVPILSYWRKIKFDKDKGHSILSVQT